ncbi:ankyrin repeat domain-containing protein [Spirochaeta lutea]|uniref:ankyrin repeat domain-containing protein n=1 Tax=Spirochaeta lutea TaxID=1480694 RepID=UPI00068DB73E|nr:ankyrin repeat domain-containing protein [Spirochaeta lutea]
MRVGVVFPERGKEQAEEVIRELQRKHSIDAIGYQFNDGWQNVNGEELQFNFSHFSQFVVITHGYESLDRMGGWIYMVLGYVLGADIPCSFFTGQQFSPGMIFRHLPVMYDQDDLVAFVRDEQHIWLQTHLIEKSREALIDQGLGLNEENLAERVVLGDVKNIENYLRIGFSPDAKDPRGTPLSVLAIRNGHQHIVHLLKEHQADLNQPSEDRGNSPLMEAAIRGSQDVLEELLSGDVELDHQSKSGQTALMLAIGEGHSEIALQLIAAGADTNLIDQLGMTARKYAELFGHTAVVEAIDSQYEKGRTVNA